MIDCMYHYASILIDGGESVEAVTVVQDERTRTVVGRARDAAPAERTRIEQSS